MTFGDAAIENDILLKGAPPSELKTTKRVLVKDELANSNKVAHSTEQEHECSDLIGTRKAGTLSLDTGEKKEVVELEVGGPMVGQEPHGTNDPGKVAAATETPTAADLDLLAQAEKCIQEERLLEGARALRKVKDQSLLQEQNRHALTKAEHIEAAVVDLTSSPNEGWTKQGESHGNHDTVIYYKVDKDTRLTARIETPIDASLLIPLLSVFNESELYQSCLPRFPNLGISSSTKLCQRGRGNQIIAVNSYMPWPLADREAIIEATAVDDIDANNHIVIKMETRYTGEEDGLIPPPKDKVVRIDFDGGILFRKCPEDHPAFAKSKHPDHDGPLILVCLTMFVDAHIKYIPQSLLNFMTRTVIGRMWSGLLAVAVDIREGKRPQHGKAIAAKKELYEWIKQRVGIMIDGMDETTDASKISAMGRLLTTEAPLTDQHGQIILGSSV
jgi:hypothetical protein